MRRGVPAMSRRAVWEIRRRFGRLAGYALRVAVTVAALCAGAAAQAGRDRATEAQLMAHIRVLASDEFAGREPGTEGEAKTLRYIGRQWFDLGLVSGTNNPSHPWFAPVTLVAREPSVSIAQFSRRGRSVPVPADEVLMLTSGKRSLVQGAPLYFVGRGRGGVPPRAELAGRVAVLLDRAHVLGREDKDVAQKTGVGAASVQNSTRQNALLAGGAIAVITVLDGSRTLASVAERRRRSGYALASEALGGDLEGFMTAPGMDRLLQSGGQRLATLEQEADREDFVPHLLDLSASLEATTREITIRTHNIIGKLPGKRPETGAVLLLAHWDHFGSCAQPPAEHLICNGAVDNASGLAALTEVARRLARGGAGLDRDVYFLATTAEELGLLGAEAFAENPPLPLKQIVAAFNLDSVAIAPAGGALAILGKGATGLDKDIAVVAREQKRRLAEAGAPEAYLARQDGWALSRHDVPAVSVTSAYGDVARLEAFFDGDYHRPSDVVKQTIELGGAAQDVAFHVALARYFADTRRFRSGVAPAGNVNSAAGGKR